jgi:hypothetical protein
MAIFARNRASETVTCRFAGLISAITVLIALALTTRARDGQARWSQPHAGWPAGPAGSLVKCHLTPERPAAFAGASFLLTRSRRKKRKRSNPDERSAGTEAHYDFLQLDWTRSRPNAHQASELR